MVKRSTQSEDFQTVINLAKVVLNAKKDAHHNRALSNLTVEHKFNTRTWHDDIEFTLKWIKANRRDHMMDNVKVSAFEDTRNRKRAFDSMIEHHSGSKRIKKDVIDPAISSMSIKAVEQQQESEDSEKSDDSEEDSEEDANSDLRFSVAEYDEEHTSSERQKERKLAKPKLSSTSTTPSPKSPHNSQQSSLQDAYKNKDKTIEIKNEISNSNTNNRPQSNIDWQVVCHNRAMDVEGSLGIMKIINSERKGPMSLRYYATQALAPFVQRMKYRNLETVAWKDGWVHLWNAALLRGEDSFRVFQMFANTFAHEPNFACHDELTYSGKFLTKRTASYKISGELVQYAEKYRMEAYGGIRRYFLKDRLIPDCNYHRIEFLPQHASLVSLSKSLRTQRFNYVTLLNLSHKTYSRQILLQVITLPHLVALDATNCNIDANIMFCWMLAMRNGLLPDLRLLCLGLNNISMGSSMIVACPFLTYVEYDHSIDTIYSNCGRWVRRHALYEKIVAAYGRGNINKPGSPNFVRHHFPKGFGISQKFFALKRLYSELKKYPPPNPPAAYPFIIQPDFGVPYTSRNRVILQEFNCANKSNSSEDPEENLWRESTTSSPAKFLQEFYKFRHSQVAQQMLQNESSS